MIRGASADASEYDKEEHMKKKNIKLWKRVSLLLVLSMLLTALVGCGSKNDTTTETSPPNRTRPTPRPMRQKPKPRPMTPAILW